VRSEAAHTWKVARPADRDATLAHGAVSRRAQTARPPDRRKTGPQKPDGINVPPSVMKQMTLTGVYRTTGRPPSASVRPSC
jgi:hypothetical protein